MDEEVLAAVAEELPKIHVSLCIQLKARKHPAAAPRSCHMSVFARADGKTSPLRRPKVDYRLSQGGPHEGVAPALRMPAGVCWL